MARHFGAVEADFQAYYGMDLRTMLWGPRRVGVRRLWSLVFGLPPDGMTVRVLATNGVPWSMQDELLATLAELIDHGNRMYFSAHARQGAQAWTPLQITRPRTVPPEPEPLEQPSRRELYESFKGDIVWDDGGQN